MKTRLLTAWLFLVPGLSLAAEKPQPPPRSLQLGKDDRIIARHDEGVCGVAFSPNGLWLATAGGDKVIRLWDPASGKEIRRLEGCRGFIRKVVFSPDGKLLASAGDDEGACLWDPATGKNLRRIGKH